jgi:hypothetical protein
MTSLILILLMSGRTDWNPKPFSRTLEEEKQHSSVPIYLEKRKEVKIEKDRSIRRPTK